MKSIFSDLVKYYTKAERVMVQRVENWYYISDGHTAAKLPEWVYSTEIKTLCGLFSEVETGKGLEIYPAKLDSVKVPAPPNIAQFFTSLADAIPVHATPFSFDIPKGKKAMQIRVFTSERFNSAINTALLKPFAKLGYSKAASRDKLSPILFTGAVYDVEYIVLPIRVGANIWATAREIAEKVST